MGHIWNAKGDGMKPPATNRVPAGTGRSKSGMERRIGVEPRAAILHHGPINPSCGRAGVTSADPVSQYTFTSLRTPNSPGR